MKKTFSFSGLNKAGIAKRLAVAALALFAASNCFGQNLASQSGAAWKFLLAGTGKGNAELGENLIKINTQTKETLNTVFSWFRQKSHSKKMPLTVCHLMLMLIRPEQ